MQIVTFDELFDQQKNHLIKEIIYTTRFYQGDINFLLNELQNLKQIHNLSRIAIDYSSQM